MLVATVIHDVPHGPVANHQCIGDQLPMALPRHGFRAHQRNAVMAGDLFHLAHDLGKFGRQHEIGIGAKAGDPPSRVHRIRQWFAKAAKIAAP